MRCDGTNAEQQKNRLENGRLEDAGTDAARRLRHFRAQRRWDNETMKGVKPL